MIKIHSFSKNYGPHHVLNAVDLEIRKGSIMGIVGPNACGKTTLIKCLLGLVMPTSGEIFIDNEKLDRQGRFRKKIGYMPQIPSYPNNLCLVELLDMLENLRQTPAPRREELINYFDLKSALHQPLEQLSGGTKQKVSAVIAFMFDPPIIILDEPTVGLDLLTSIYLKELILKAVGKGTTIIFVSHIIAEIEKLATEMTFIDEGRVVFSGPVASLLQKMNAVQLEQAIAQLLEKSKQRHFCG
jgi:Cu-processing system ATP-binding protein